jgi:hypothetical protein
VKNLYEGQFEIVTKCTGLTHGEDVTIVWGFGVQHGGFHRAFKLIFRMKDGKCYKFPYYIDTGYFTIGEKYHDQGNRRKGDQYECYQVFPKIEYIKQVNYYEEKPNLKDLFHLKRKSYSFKHLVKQLQKCIDEDSERADSTVIFQHVSGTVKDLIEKEIDITRFMFLTDRVIIKMSDKE